jgi:hypothetical protein
MKRRELFKQRDASKIEVSGRERAFFMTSKNEVFIDLPSANTGGYQVGI